MDDSSGQRERDAAEVLDALPERVVRYRLPDLTIAYCNRAWAAFYGLTVGQVIGRSLDQFLSESGRQGLARQLARLGPDTPMLADEVPRTDLNNPGHWVEWVDRYLPTGEVIAVGRDCTERYLAQQALIESEARFRALADNSGDIVWRCLVEPHPHFDYVSPSIERILGYPPSWLLADFTRLLDILDSESRDRIIAAFHGEELPERCDLRYRRRDGRWMIGEMQTTPIHGGLQGVTRDVTELRLLQDELNALALHDPLTGLANRRLLDELMEVGLARTQRNGQPLAVAFIDLDDFKSVNDNHGHDAGDVVLCETARRLQATARSADVIARVGGDEFIVVYEPTESGADHLVERLDAALSKPIRIGAGVEVECRASVGCADTFTAGRDPGGLIAAADAAMFEAKKLHARARSR